MDGTLFVTNDNHQDLVAGMINQLGLVEGINSK